MFSVPFSGSLLIYSALGLLFIGLAMLVLFIATRVRRIIRRLRRKPAGRGSIITSTPRLLLILLLISVSIAMLFLGALIQSYVAFTHRELAATVRCTPVPGTKKI